VLVRLDHVAVTDLTHFRIFSRDLAPDFTHYFSKRPEMTSQDESSRKAKPTRKKNKMAQKKTKKTNKVRDLKPKKDAKGGRGGQGGVGGSGYGNRRVR
jgi:hypothetical protein